MIIFFIVIVVVIFISISMPFLYIYNDVQTINHITIEEAELKSKFLASDANIIVADNVLVLPIVALRNYAYSGLSFSLNRDADQKMFQDKSKNFQKLSSSIDTAPRFDRIDVTVQTYGYDESNLGVSQMICPQLTRRWSQAVCSNPWSAVRQALPGSGFTIIDLRALKTGHGNKILNCKQNSDPPKTVNLQPEEALLMCEASVVTYSGISTSKFFVSAVSINQDLGAVWTVSEDSRSLESAQSEAEREGKAIVAFVRHGLGPEENFPALQSATCALRRPGSVDGPKGADC